MKKISVVIPVHPATYPEKALRHLSQVNYPLEDIEIIIAEGERPSQQRNEAVGAAQGEFIYFLDDDSFVEKDAIAEGLKFLQEPGVTAVGGPAITYSEASFLEKCFGEVMASFWGGWVTRSRHRPMGEARRVRGEELILCNLMIRKSFFLDAAGLNVNLHPNEENEMIKRMRKAGNVFYYNPKMIVHRTRRRSIGQFMKQSFRYGFGRAKHVFLGIEWKDLPFLVPGLFTLYALVLLFAKNLWFGIPFAIYLVLTMVASIRSAIRLRTARRFWIFLLLFPLNHFSYGIGSIVGMLSRRFKKPHHTSGKIELRIFSFESLHQPNLNRSPEETRQRQMPEIA